MKVKAKAMKVTSCRDCPFARSYNVCGAAPVGRNFRLLPRPLFHGQAPDTAPDWCPLRKRDITVTLDKT